MIRSRRTLPLLVVINLVGLAAVRGADDTFLPAELMVHFGDCQYYRRLALSDENRLRKNLNDVNASNALTARMIAYYDAQKGSVPPCYPQQLRQEILMFFRRYQNDTGVTVDEQSLGTLLSNFKLVFDAITPHIKMIIELHTEFTDLVPSLSEDDKLKAFSTIAYLEKVFMASLGRDVVQSPGGNRMGLAGGGYRTIEKGLRGYGLTRIESADPTLNADVFPDEEFETSAEAQKHIDSKEFVAGLKYFGERLLAHPSSATTNASPRAVWTEYYRAISQKNFSKAFDFYDEDSQRQMADDMRAVLLTLVPDEEARHKVMNMSPREIYTLLGNATASAPQQIVSVNEAADSATIYLTSPGVEKAMPVYLKKQQGVWKLLYVR